jgi:hypothetical protein
VVLAGRSFWICKSVAHSRIEALKVPQTAMAIFQAVTTTQLGNGKSAHFWLNGWLQGKRIGEFAPNLLSAVRRAISRILLRERELYKVYKKYICVYITEDKPTERARGKRKPLSLIRQATLKQGYAAGCSPCAIRSNTMSTVLNSC